MSALEWTLLSFRTQSDSAMTLSFYLMLLNIFLSQFLSYGI